MSQATLLAPVPPMLRITVADIRTMVLASTGRPPVRALDRGSHLSPQISCGQGGAVPIWKKHEVYTLCTNAMVSLPGRQIGGYRSIWPSQTTESDGKNGAEASSSQRATPTAESVYRSPMCGGKHDGQVSRDRTNGTPVSGERVAPRLHPRLHLSQSLRVHRRQLLGVRLGQCMRLLHLRRPLRLHLRRNLRLHRLQFLRLHLW